MIDATIGKEGGYSNHPADRGGPTRWGITERVARANGYAGDMKLLSRPEAVRIYRDQYLVAPGFAAIAEISPAIGEELFDSGVNLGPALPKLWLQQALNALNAGGTLYPDIKEDGDLGRGTRAAFRAYLKARGAEATSVMLKALNCLQGARYLELARTRGSDEAFVFGWLRARVTL